MMVIQQDSFQTDHQMGSPRPGRWHRAQVGGGWRRLLVNMMLVLIAFALFLGVVRRYGASGGFATAPGSGEVSGAVSMVTVKSHLSQAQEVRLEFVLAVHDLLRGRCPESLESLVDMGLLHASDLTHPRWNEPWQLTRFAGGCSPLRPLR